MDAASVQIARNQWHYLDAYLELAGVPVAGLVIANVTVTYKKRGDLVFTSKALNTTSVTLAQDVSIGDTDLYLDDSDSLPQNGRLIVDPAGVAEVVSYNNNNYAAGHLTLTSGLVNAFSDGDIATRVDWIEVTGGPDGYYLTLFSPGEISNLDTFVFSVEPVAALFDPYSLILDVVDEDVVAQTAPSLATCILQDHIVDLSGSPAENVAISARLLALPDTVGGTGVRDDIISARTDVNGFFQLEVIQGSTLDVAIPVIGWRRTLVVPSSVDANLFDLG